MNWADWVILGLIGLSVIVSLWRGFIKEAFSLAVWVVAFWLAFLFAEPAAGFFTRWVGLPSARIILAFALIFLAALIVGGLLNFLIGKLVEKTGLSGTDRVLGVVFGAARGLLIVTLVVMLAGLTPFPRDPWWHESRLLPHFEELSLWAADFLPEALGDQIGYDEPAPVAKGQDPKVKTSG